MMGGIKVYTCFAFILIAIDFLVKDVPSQVRNRCLRAFIDNGGHFITALISWLMVRSVHGFTLKDKLVIVESLACGVISSLTDLDHFIQAQSLHLEDVVSLSSRPFMHCSSLTIGIFVILLNSSLVCGLWWLHSLSFIAWTSWTTHHLRDGLRRGLWFYPLGSTKPLNYPLYIFIVLLLPVVTSFMFDLTGAMVLSTNVADMTYTGRRMHDIKNRRKTTSIEKDVEATTNLLSDVV
jgi:hypothetical protein